MQRCGSGWMTTGRVLLREIIITAKPSRFKKCFFPTAIRLLNKHH